MELVRAFLERIEDVDDQLHAFITVLHEEALSEARSAEADISSEETTRDRFTEFLWG